MNVDEARREEFETLVAAVEATVAEYDVGRVQSARVLTDKGYVSITADLSRQE